MNAMDLADVTADPIQFVGMSFYFAPPTVERAAELGLHRYEFYGLGRGGVLGDVDSTAVAQAFTFFHPAAVERFWGACEKADPVETAEQYLQAAYDFADRTFGEIPVTVLADYAAAAHKVARGVEPGHHRLVDGYRQYPVPADPVHAAYLGAIMMRELRGCVHIDAVHEAGVSVEEACFLSDPENFKRHGYSDDDVPQVSPDTEARMARAEVATSAAMADYFAVLSDDERQQLCDGAFAMFDAIKSPVAVTR